MSDGRLDHDWSIASNLMWAALTPHIPKHKRVKPQDLNPRAPENKPVKLDEAQSLKAAKQFFAGVVENAPTPQPSLDPPGM